MHASGGEGDGDQGQGGRHQGRHLRLTHDPSPQQQRADQWQLGERSQGHRPSSDPAVDAGGGRDRDSGQRAEGKPEPVTHQWATTGQSERSRTRPATTRATWSLAALTAALSRPRSSLNIRPDAVAGTTDQPTSLLTRTMSALAEPRASSSLVVSLHRWGAALSGSFHPSTSSTNRVSQVAR